MPENTITCPACPANCAGFEMPAVQSDYCTDAMVLELSEIKRILVAEVDQTDKTKALGGPTDWTDKAAWTTAINNTTSNKVRSIYGIGDIPEPESTTVTVHDNQTKVISKKYGMNFDIQDVNTVNYTAARTLQCGGSVRFWYETRGGYLYGGADGIPATIANVTSPNERGADAYKMIKLLLNWNAKCEPERIASPFDEETTPP